VRTFSVEYAIHSGVAGQIIKSGTCKVQAHDEKTAFAAARTWVENNDKYYDPRTIPSICGLNLLEEEPSAVALRDQIEEVIIGVEHESWPYKDEFGNPVSKSTYMADKIVKLLAEELPLVPVDPQTGRGVIHATVYRQQLLECIKAQPQTAYFD